ncbi:MAG: hypothetical protein AB1597_07320 [Chloroflexota bacterium]
MKQKNHSATLKAFSVDEVKKAKLRLATQVANMMGRKLEEDDWNKVYCAAKGIPHKGWSNLNIDVSCGGLGVEQKLLRVSGLNGRPIESVCGTTMMHPAATRSIRIDNVDRPANEVMRDVFQQYAELIELRRQKVREESPDTEPDMRTGWLLWEDTLTEFLYFEQRLEAPDPDDYYAEWNETVPRGARKRSKSLWIFNRTTNLKRFSVTTSAGIKIQPYFDVPSPSDPNLYYFRVQSEPIGEDSVQIWVSASTARAIRHILGNLDKAGVSKAVMEAARVAAATETRPRGGAELAQPIRLTRDAFDVFHSTWDGVSDEHRAQLFLESLHSMKK